MICTNCGIELGDDVLQCHACGMPTDNVPVIKAHTNKKIKKKDPNKIPANIPAIISLPLTFFALANLFLAIIASLLGWHLYNIEGGGFFAYWFDSLNNLLPNITNGLTSLSEWLASLKFESDFLNKCIAYFISLIPAFSEIVPVFSELFIYLSSNLVIFLSFYSFSLAIGFMSNGYQLTIASIVLNIIAKIKRKMNQKFPIISICFAVLAIVAALFVAIILLIYFPPRIYIDLCRLLFN